MNVVIFGKGFGTPRQVNLTGAWAVLSVAVVAGMIISAGFAAGSWHASRTGSGISANELEGLTGQLQEQRVSIETIRQENEDTLDALSIRVAQMNARMIRLDALGRRLTDMADINDGEFDFDSDPAMGGPEEPMFAGTAGSNVAVPDMLDAMDALGAQLSDRSALNSSFNRVPNGPREWWRRSTRGPDPLACVPGTRLNENSTNAEVVSERFGKQRDTFPSIIVRSDSPDQTDHDNEIRRRTS